MTEILQLEFMRHAIVAVLLASVALGVIGTLVVANREVFITDGIAHAAYSGVGLAFLTGGDPSRLALAAGVIAALAMGLTRRLSGLRHDTVIGVIFAVGMSLGVIFVHQTPDTGDAHSFLFGSLLTVSTGDLWLSAGATVAVCAFVAAYHRPLMAFSFDERFARARNLPTTALELAFLTAVAVAVVVLMQMVGIILLISMVVIPAATANRLTTTLVATMALTVAVGAVTSLGGLAGAHVLDWPAGPTIVLTATGLFVGSIAAGHLRKSTVTPVR